MKGYVIGALAGILVGMALLLAFRPEPQWKVYQFGMHNVGLERVNVRTGEIQYAGLGCPWTADYVQARACLNARFEGR